MVNWSPTQSASELEYLTRLNEAFAAALAPLTMVSRFAPSVELKGRHSACRAGRGTARRRALHEGKRALKYHANPARPVANQVPVYR